MSRGSVICIILHSGFPVQDVDPIAAEGIPTAGYPGYTLICNVSREPQLTATLAVQWIDPSGNIIIDNGTNFTVSGNDVTNDVVLTSRLTFTSLYTSQAGVYTCRTLQTIRNIVSNHSVEMTYPVRVKCKSTQSTLTTNGMTCSFCPSVPPPSTPTFSLSRNTTLNAGTNFSLTCLITPNTTGVDTAFTVESIFTGPATPDSRVGVSQPTSVGGVVYETVMTFQRLFESDTGSYNCSAVISSSTAEFIDVSDSAYESQSITVGRKLFVV